MPLINSLCSDASCSALQNTVFSTSLPILAIISAVFAWEAMDKDVESMAQIGAQIISTGGNETAEAVRIRKSSSMASLGGIVANIEAGDRNVIKWMMMFNNESGQPDELMLELNRKFYDERIEPQMLQQLVTMNFQGKLPDEYLFKVLKDNKFALDGDSIVEYIERIGDIPSTGMNLDEE